MDSITISLARNNFTTMGELCSYVDRKLGKAIEELKLNREKVNFYLSSLTKKEAVYSIVHLHKYRTNRESRTLERIYKFCSS